MKKFFKVLQNYLVLSFPFVLLTMAWSSVLSAGRPETGSRTLYLLWEALSWNLILWFVMLVVFLLLIVFYPLAREQTLRRIANIKERDERESLITGKASRATFISTLSVLIFLLFLSTFQLEMKRLPPNEVVDGKSRLLSLGFKMQLLDAPQTVKNEKGEILFENKDLPLSKSSLLLLLIVWQLIAYNWNVRKQLQLH